MKKETATVTIHIVCPKCNSILEPLPHAMVCKNRRCQFINALG